MTAEKALEILNGNKDVWRELGYESIREFNKDWDIAFDMAIEALEQEPCEDCISRETTIEAIYKKYIGGKDAIKKAPINDLYADGLAEAVDAVWDMPSVQPTRPTGKWIDVGVEGLVFKCSLCGDKNMIESYFCPNCGAKMEEIEE